MYTFALLFVDQGVRQVYKYINKVQKEKIKFIQISDNQIKERKRNQRKAKLFPDTELRKNIPQYFVIGKFPRDFAQMFQSISKLVG